MWHSFLVTSASTSSQLLQALGRCLLSRWTIAEVGLPLEHNLVNESLDVVKVARLGASVVVGAIGEVSPYLDLCLASLVKSLHVARTAI